MATTNGTDGTQRAIRSLGELSRDVPPPRDLWPNIAAQIESERRQSGGRADADSAGTRGRMRPSRLQWLSLAAVIAALAVGIWLGRTVLPGSASQTPPTVASNVEPAGAVLPASLVTDPRYTKQREQMIQALEAQLNTLPPETQQKVASSLKTIRASMKDIQAALGRDPANALLQELLVNTYQDEMRVLTAVHEASDAGQGI
jgi:hypothetical protein